MLRDPDVAVVGCAGATGVRSIAWWEGRGDGGAVGAAVRGVRRRRASGLLVDRAGALPPAEVDTIDGQLLVLSPWAVRNLRFDESLLFNYGFELDFCLQVRAAGRRVVVADLRAVFHRSLELVKDLDVWAQAHIRLAEKWDGTLHPEPADEEAWKRRARYAEADREAARAFAFSKSLKLDARVLELEREYERATHSLSWRVTAPLRAANRLRRSMRSKG